MDRNRLSIRSEDWKKFEGDNKIFSLNEKRYSRLKSQNKIRSMNIE